MAPEQWPPDTSNLQPERFRGTYQELAEMLKAGAPKDTILERAERRGVLREILRVNPDARPGAWDDMGGVLADVSYHWQGWLPDSMLTMIAAESEMGKSILALRIAKSYLTGAAWPDGQPFTGETGCVLWAEAESAQAINLDRARKWGLPLGHVYTPFEDTLQDIILDDKEHREQLQSIAGRPEVRLVVVDSLSGGNTRTDENSAGMINLVKWLGELAKVAGKPVLLTHHLNKFVVADNPTLTLSRVRGSSAIVQVPRVIWGLDRPDPNSNATRLSVIKSNLGTKPQPLGFTIDDQGPHFTNEPPEAPRNETLQEKAAVMLRGLLKNGPVPAVELQAKLEDVGISWDAAKRVRSKAGIVAIRNADHWEWALK